MLDASVPGATDSARPRLVAFSPDGSQLLYTVEPAGGLVVRGVDGSQGQRLLNAGELFGGRSRNFGAWLSWGANGMVYVPMSGTAGILLQLETDRATATAPPLFFSISP